MRGNKMVQLSVLFMLGLCILLLQLYPEFFSPTEEVNLLEISVLLRHSEDTTWSNARRGMEQSAVDWGVELRFLSIDEPDDADAQIALLQREVEGGADGIVLAPCHTDLMSSVVADTSYKLPVITLESPMAEEGTLLYLGTDPVSTGTLLGETVAEALSYQGDVLLLDTAPHSAGITQRLESAQAVLEAAGCQVTVLTISSWSTISQTIQSQLENTPVQAVIAFEPEALEVLAQVTSQSPSAPLVYGMGSSSLIASYLEQDLIAAIAVQNEYAIGYLAIEMLAQAARQDILTPLDHMDIKLITQDNMYESENAKLLFPVTR